MSILKRVAKRALPAPWRSRPEAELLRSRGVLTMSIAERALPAPRRSRPEAELLRSRGVL